MIKCKFCGTEIPDGNQFCSACGAKNFVAPAKEAVVLPPPTADNQSSQKQTKNPSRHIGLLAWSVANICTGALSCCFFVPFVSFVMGIIGLVYTLLGSNTNNAEEEREKIKVAKTLNIIATIITIVSLIVYLFLLALGILSSGELMDLMEYYYYID